LPYRLHRNRRHLPDLDHLACPFMKKWPAHCCIGPWENMPAERRLASDDPAWGQGAAAGLGSVLLRMICISPSQPAPADAIS
jgi:hypothetical protein